MDRYCMRKKALEKKHQSLYVSLQVVIDLWTSIFCTFGIELDM